MTLHGARRRRLLSLARDKQVVAMTPGNLFYLTDFWGGGAAVVRQDETVLITSALDADRAEEIGREVEVVKVKRWAEVPQRTLRELKRGGAVVDSDESFRSEKRFESAPGLFLEARRTKDEEELSRIRRASEVQDRIFEELEEAIEPGKTEWEVAAEVMKIATMNRLTPADSGSALSPVIIASGENGALPHGELSQRRIRQGDFVVADIFFRSDGYFSDETRTFGVGRVTAEMKRRYGAVLEAQTDALEKVKAGAKSGDVNEEAVRALRRHGLERHLNHSVGHGVGIDIHELPGIYRNGRTRLARDDVVTVEPGAYFLGEYGIRIEDTVRVGDGAVPLTRYTKELIEL